MSKKFSRKKFLRNIAGGIGSAVLLKNIPLQAMTTKDKSHILQQTKKTFTQIPLNYNYGDLEPYIDEQTMKIHHTKHAYGYMTKLNTYWNKEVQDKKITSLKMLLNTISQYSPNLRNNAGGHYNHEFFWKLLSPKSNFTENLDIVKSIQANFGSIEKFKTEFFKKAKSIFGSGWCWLIKDSQGNLKITSTPNQDNPLMDNVKDKGAPIIGLDVWEHAYYLKYQNKRGDYINNFWNVVNWETANYNFKQIN